MVRSRTLATLLSGLGVCIGLVLAPAVAAEAADTPNITNVGGTQATSLEYPSLPVITLAFVKTVTYDIPNCSDSDPSNTCTLVYAGFNVASGDVNTAFDGRAGDCFSYLTTDPAFASSNGVAVQCGGIVDPTNYGPSEDIAPGLQAHSASFFVTMGDGGHFAGFTCFGYDGGDQSACHANDSSTQYGWARDNDIGHGAQDPNPNDGPLPGQQADGTIDIMGCFQSKMGGSDNPFEAVVMAPLYAGQCVFLWAITPPSTMMQELTTHQADLWNSTQLGATVQALDLTSAFANPSTSCSGIAYNFDFLHIPGQKALPKPGNFLAACSGSQLAPVASLVFLGLTVALLVGGGFKLIRMITAFVKGPQLDDKPDWEDTRLF